MCHRIVAARFAVCWAVLIAGALLIPPRPAFACTPPPGGLPTYTAAERARDSDLVILGTVAGLSDGPGGTPDEVATIAVERYLKGDGPDPIIVSGYGPGSICRSQLNTGARLIFYVVRSGPDSYFAYYKSQFDAVAAPSAETIAEIEAAVRADANRVYLPLLNAFQPPPPPLGTAAPLAAAIGLFTLLGIVVVARRRL